jgi:hypothetical protein
MSRVPLIISAFGSFFFPKAATHPIEILWEMSPHRPDFYVKKNRVLAASGWAREGMLESCVLALTISMKNVAKDIAA